MSEFLICSAQYHNDSTFKRSRNFSADNFWNFRFYPLLRCDFLTPKTRLVIFYGLQNRYKLRDQSGRAHGFPVRANGCARRTAISYSQIHFHTTQRQALVKNQIFKLIQHMKRFFKLWPPIFGSKSILKLASCASKNAN